LVSYPQKIGVREHFLRRYSRRVVVRAWNYYQLTKPGLTALVVVTVFPGFYLACTGSINWQILSLAFLGTALSAGGSCALNMYVERDADARMKRTQNRPIVSGRISAQEGFWVGLILVSAGAGVLALWVNLLTAALSLLASFTYIFLYTPMKRRSPLATFVGAVPGALPPMMGYTAVTGHIGVEAWIVFAILFFWQLPHFWALALLFGDDYARGEFHVRPQHIELLMILASLVLTAVSLMLCVWGHAGTVYAIGALALGILMVIRAFRLYLQRTRESAFSVFYGSLIYLPALIAILVLDRPSVLLLTLGIKR